MHLTEEQARLVRGTSGPVEMDDPTTRRAYVLLDRETYDRVCHLLEGEASPRGAGAGRDVPPGVRRSQEAYWRDLPELLREKSHRGLWVCYRGDERVGIGTREDLLREVRRRGLKEEEYDLAMIRARDRPPWEPEAVEAPPHEFTETRDEAANRP